MRKRGRLILLAAATLLATAGVAAVAGARSLAKEPGGSSTDATATARTRDARARASTPTLADAPVPEEPTPPAAWRPDPWDHFNPYERWVRNVPLEHTHAVR